MTTINPALSATGSLNQLDSIGKTRDAGGGEAFTETLNNALSQVSSAEQQAYTESLQLLTGDSGNIHNVVLAAEKADIALQLTMQVRNKVLDAYNDMMRMQI